ncbi:MAG: hypothetical protein DRH12_13775 [Deltaproteobacteria bacterium]|nr:MAG: hypothetical protein DRH12_13775 [Deltaproteobacteria bacterium]
MQNPYHWLIVNPDLFYGSERLKMVKEIISGIFRCESFAIVGGRRLGKTTLLRRLEKEIRRTCPALLPVYIDAQAMPGASSSGEAFEWIRGCVENTIHADLTGNNRHLGGWIPAATDKANCLKLVLLFDEFDSFREYAWCSTFFNNLRALIHNTPGISEKLSVVVAGARTMQTLRDSPGSPLANVLTWRYLSLLNEADTKRMVHEPTAGRFSPEVGERVWSESGGHPFIIQFLMYHLCEWERELGVEQALEMAKNKLIEEHDILFRQWWFDHIEEKEREVYRTLRRGRMTVEQIAKDLGYKESIIRELIKTLLYIGLVRREEGLYAISGEIFDKWVQDNDVEKQRDEVKLAPASHSLHELFDEVEKAIREFVTIRLIQINELKNLPKIFPDQVQKANEIYRKERGVDQDCPLEEILLFSDFAFPFEIVLRFWKSFYGAFSQTRDKILGRDVNKAKQRFEERKEVLTVIRNKIRHSRSITDDERNKARVFCRDLLQLLPNKE